MILVCPKCEERSETLPLRFVFQDGEITTACCDMEPLTAYLAPLNEDQIERLFAKERDRVLEDMAEGGCDIEPIIRRGA